MNRGFRQRQHECVNVRGNEHSVQVEQRIRNKIKPLDEKFHFSRNELKLMIIFGYSIFDVTCFTGKAAVFVYVRFVLYTFAKHILVLPMQFRSAFSWEIGVSSIRTEISVRFY